MKKKLEQQQLDYILSLKEEVLTIINFQLIPLQSELASLTKNDLEREKELAMRWQAIRDNFISKYNELIDLCDEHGMQINTYRVRFINRPDSKIVN